MAEKFHFQPRPLNDTFSSHIFTQLLKQLDEDKIYFTAGDIQALSKFQFQLDNEIKSQQSDFLAAITKIFSQRMAVADTMISDIGKTAFNFSLNELITPLEMNTYPANEKAARSKLYKFMKADALDMILDHDKLFSLSAGQQKKYVDSIEPAIRYKVLQSYQNFINNLLQSPGGIFQSVGDEYCKAISVCYDPHTEFFPLTEKENFESLLGQQSMAFGFQFKNLDDGSVRIENILPGSPAFKSGQINNERKITVGRHDRGDVSLGYKPSFFIFPGTQFVTNRGDVAINQ